MLSDRGRQRAEKAAARVLLAPLMPAAKSALKSFLKGQQHGTAKPRAADVLRAVELVLEREAPAVHRTATVTATVDMSTEDRERMRTALGIASASPAGGEAGGSAPEGK